MLIKALYVPAEGEPRIVEVDNTDISQYYGYTNGPYIEAVREASGAAVIYCNEDAVQKGLPPNAIATMLFTVAGVNMSSGVARGDVIIVGPTDGEGWDTPIPDEFAALFQGVSPT